MIFTFSEISFKGTKKICQLDTLGEISEENERKGIFCMNLFNKKKKNDLNQ